MSDSSTSADVPDFTIPKKVIRESIALGSVDGKESTSKKESKKSETESK